MSRSMTQKTIKSMPRPYSASRIKHWIDCQYSCAAHYIGNIKQEDVGVMLGGSLFHRLAHDYMQHLIQTEQPTDIEAVNSIIAKGIKAEPIGVVDEYSGLFREWAPGQCNNGGKVMLEKKLAVDDNFQANDMWDSPDVFFRGVIDKLILDDIPTVIDYKTNHVIPSEKEMENSLQTRVYPLLVSKTFGINTQIRVVYDFVRFNRQMEFIVYPEQYKAIEAWLKKKGEEIESTTEYTATFCSRCEYCGSRADCPAIKKALKNDNIIMPTGEADAVSLAETLIALQGRTKEITKLLKLYLQNHESITVGDQRYMQKVSESYEFHDLEKLVNLMKERGIAKEYIWQALTASKTNFERALKKAKMIEIAPEIVEEVGTPKIATRTQFYKVK